MSEKKTLNARAVVLDIKVGMTDTQLMMKYGLSEKGLQSLEKKLVAAGLLPEAELNRPSPPRPIGSPSTATGDGRLEETVDLDPKSLRLDKAPTASVTITGKRKLSAKEILADVTAGLSNTQLMVKHEISAESLEKVLTKLMGAGLIQQSEFDKRISDLKGGKPPSLWKCPSCGMPQPQAHVECPQCGILVSKYLEKQAKAQQQPEVVTVEEPPPPAVIKPDTPSQQPVEDASRPSDTAPRPGRVIQVDVSAGVQTAKNLFNKAKKATDQVVGSVQAKLDKLEEDAEELPEEVKQKFFGLTVVSACMILITAALFAWMVAWLLTSSWGWFLVCWLVLGAIVTGTGIAVLKATKLNYKYLTIPATVLLGLNITFPFIGAGGSPDCCDIAMKFCDEIDKVAVTIKNEGELLQAMNNLMIKVETKVKPAIETSCGDCSPSIFKEMMEYLGTRIDTHKSPERDIAAAAIRAKIKGECTECKRGKKQSGTAPRETTARDKPVTTPSRPDNDTEIDIYGAPCKGRCDQLMEIVRNRPREDKDIDLVIGGVIFGWMHAGCFNQVRLCLERNVNVRKAQSSGRKPLMHAIVDLSTPPGTGDPKYRENFLNTTKLLLNKGLEVNAIDDGQTALQYLDWRVKMNDELTQANRAYAAKIRELIVKHGGR